MIVNGICWSTPSALLKARCIGPIFKIATESLWSWQACSIFFLFTSTFGLEVVTSRTRSTILPGIWLGTVVVVKPQREPREVWAASVELRYPSVLRLRCVSIVFSIICRTSSAFRAYSGIILLTWFGLVWPGNHNLTQPGHLSSRLQLS